MRRNNLLEMTPAESAIHIAIIEVEGVGADPVLTDIILQLQKAKDCLSDFVDKGGVHTDSGDPVPPDPAHPHPKDPK